MLATFAAVTIAPGRTALASLVEGRFAFTATRDGGRRYYEFRAAGTLRPILEGIVEIPVTRVGVPNGIRTRVLALKGPRPRPLDDGDAGERNLRILARR